MRISDDGYPISGSYGEAMDALRIAARQFVAGERVGKLYAAALRMAAEHLKVQSDYNTASLLEAWAKDVEVF